MVTTETILRERASIMPSLLLLISFLLLAVPSKADCLHCTDENGEQLPEVVLKGCDPEAKCPQTSGCFDKVADAFGVKLWGSTDLDEWAFEHTYNVLLKYLDSNEDGEPDDPKLVEMMAGSNRDMAVIQCAGSIGRSTVKDRFLAVVRSYGQASLNDENCQQLQRLAIEEIHHAIEIGLGSVYPEVFGRSKSSELWQACNDLYGNCEKVDLCAPNCDHYDCVKDGDEYSCPFIEGSCDGAYHYGAVTGGPGGIPTGEVYYFAFTSWKGWQKDYCDEIKDEWELCTPDLFINDPRAKKMYDLVSGTSPSQQRYGYVQPSILPDGEYDGPKDTNYTFVVDDEYECTDVKDDDFLGLGLCDDPDSFLCSIVPILRIILEIVQFAIESLS